MFFEGSEKKIEVVFKNHVGSLRKHTETFWQGIVAASQAKILSKISNDQVDAYLLSESSLFVYDHYLIMITCGTTRLISAVEELMKTYKPEDIEAFFYERKNEILPQAQSSHFFQDVKLLKQWFPGEALRFGQEDEHHIYLFASTGTYEPRSSDCTMEILMHGIDPKMIQTFSECSGCDVKTLRKQSGIDCIVRGQVDDFVFDPVGYSLNSIDKDHYYTIHVTPESFGSYVSFETNAFDAEEQIEWVNKVIEVFKPRSFDLMLFNQKAIEPPEYEGFLRSRNFKENIQSGYCTQYFSFYQPDLVPKKPYRFEEFL